MGTIIGAIALFPMMIILEIIAINFGLNIMGIFVTLSVASILLSSASIILGIVIMVKVKRINANTVVIVVSDIINILLIIGSYIFIIWGTLFIIEWVREFVRQLFGL